MARKKLDDRPAPPTVQEVIDAGYVVQIANVIVGREQAKALEGFEPYGDREYEGQLETIPAIDAALKAPALRKVVFVAGATITSRYVAGSGGLKILYAFANFKCPNCAAPHTVCISLLTDPVIQCACGQNLIFTEEG